MTIAEAKRMYEAAKKATEAARLAAAEAHSAARRADADAAAAAQAERAAEQDLRAARGRKWLEANPDAEDVVRLGRDTERLAALKLGRIVRQSWRGARWEWNERGLDVRAALAAMDRENARSISAGTP